MVRTRYVMYTEHAVSLVDALEWAENHDPRGLKIVSVLPGDAGSNLFRIVYRWQEEYTE